MSEHGYYEEQPRPASISKLIQYLEGNPVVTSVLRTGPQIIYIEREERPALTVYLTNTYTVSESDVFEILCENPLVDAIVTMSAWNGYTSSAKEFCKERNIGLFKFKEFLGAVYHVGNKFLGYTPPKSSRRDKCLSYPEIRIGVFGSCLDGNLIRDVDLLLIYREHVPIERLIKFREKLREEILFAFGLPVDLCTFSEAEAAENPFIDEEGVIMLTGLG